jgi:CDP-glycerol glycerophosphotransferase (TagB/SpsB family)
MVPRQWDGNTYMRQFAWRVGAYRAYLNHGVDVDTNVLRRRVGGYDVYVTTMVREAAAARATSGYDEQIVQTGLARYDALVPTAKSHTILFMPTWRQYLVPKLFRNSDEHTTPFEGSTYQQFIVGFLTNERLAALLERHDYRLQFMPHYNLRTQLADVPVGSDRITVLDGASADIQDLMLACDLFVTDHSSVHFDIAYLGTPLIYSHFDNADYRALHATPSWFDHERDGFGPVVDDLDSTIDAIEAYLEGGCSREPEYDRRAAEAFTYRDRDNARRNVAAIEALRSQGARPRSTGAETT